MYYVPKYSVGGYLMHHGILGQKWGQRNGPPYPLGSSDHSTSEKKAGYRKSIKNRRKQSIQTKNKENNQSSLAAAGTAVAIRLGAFLAVAAASKAITAINNKATNSEVKKATKQKTGEIDEVTGFHLKDKKYSADDDLKETNPFYNPKKKAFSNNCVNCSITYEMRRRGYDVMANSSVEGYNGTAFASKLFNISDKGFVGNCGNYMRKNSTVENIVTKNNSEKNKAKSNAMRGMNIDHAQKVVSDMSSKENQRGFMAVTYGAGGGHMSTYEVKNGKFTIRDPQTNEVLSGNQVIDFLSMTYLTSYMRTDNADINQKNIKKARRACS